MCNKNVLGLFARKFTWPLFNTVIEKKRLAPKSWDFRRCARNEKTVLLWLRLSSRRQARACLTVFAVAKSTSRGVLDSFARSLWPVSATVLLWLGRLGLGHWGIASILQHQHILQTLQTLLHTVLPLPSNTPTAVPDLNRGNSIAGRQEEARHPSAMQTVRQCTRSRPSGPRQGRQRSGPAMPRTRLC